MTKLISFIVPSRRLENLRGLFDNLEQNTADLSCFEVLVKLDKDQLGAKEFIEAEKEKRPFVIKFIITPRFEGAHSLWVAMEQLFYLSDQSSYFVQIISDEPRFETLHWDKVLQKYIGFFSDHVFRLRLSKMKFCNYATHYECTFRPDSFPIYTRKWLELTEGTGDCWGSDAYHQCVAYHLSLGPRGHTNVYRDGALCRDVVVYDITLSGLEFGVGVSPDEQRERHKRNLKEWARLTSFPMQEHFSYLARRINCYIWAHEHGIRQFRLVKHPIRKTVTLHDIHGKELLELPYALSRLIIYTQNFSREMIMLPRKMILMLLKGPSLLLPRKKQTLAHACDPEPVKLTAKQKVKFFLNKFFILLTVPIHFATCKLDAMLMRPSPGITALSKKRNIQKGYPLPTDEDCLWLKQELLTRKNAAKVLSDKEFNV